MIKRDEHHGIKFDPVGAVRITIEVVIILVTLSWYLGGMKQDIAVHATQINSMMITDTRLEKKVDDNRLEREVQMTKIETRLNMIYDLMLAQQGVKK